MRACHFILMVATMLTAGCSATPSYNMAPVSGVVTLDGHPLSGAIVNFQPISTGSESAGLGSTAHCDDQGRYVLKTIRSDPGAVVAVHRVTIYPASPTTDPAAHPPGTNTDSLAVISSTQQIPRRYNYESTLTFEVPAGGSTAADFHLTSSP